MARKSKKNLEPLPKEVLDDERYSLLAPSMSNISMYANYDIDSAAKQLYDNAPPAALHAVEVLVITGLCRTMRKLQLSVYAETGEMLTEEVINYHLSQKRLKLQARKEQFAEKQREAVVESLDHLASEPEALRYQRMANDIAISLERQIAAVSESRYVASPSQIKEMLFSVKQLMEVDPLYIRGQRKGEIKRAGKQAGVTARAKAEAYFSSLANFKEDYEKDVDYGDLATFTEEIIDRAGGGADDTAIRPESAKNCGAGEADVQDEERAGQSA